MAEVPTINLFFRVASGRPNGKSKTVHSGIQRTIINPSVGDSQLFITAWGVAMSRYRVAPTLFCQIHGAISTLR